MKTKAGIMAIVTSLILMLSGCGTGTGPEAGSGNGAAPAKAGVANEVKPAEPITLTFYASTLFEDNDFKQYLVEPAQKKFPNITLNKLDRTDKQYSFQNLIAAGIHPDLIIEGLTNIANLIEYDLPMDLTALAKENKLDMKRFGTDTEANIRATAPKGELLAIPFSHELFATQYNKDIFDKFAVPYPKDGMTWDDLLDLSKRVTREADGIQYQGMNMQNLNRINRQMSLPWIDPATGQAAIGVAKYEDAWKTNFQTIAPFFMIPGQKLKVMSGKAQFLTKTLAMLPDLFLPADQLELFLKTEKETGLNWDMATYPTFKGQPKISSGGYMTSFFISKGAKYPKEAMQLIALWTSDEVQLENAKKGRIPSLSNLEILRHSFDNVPEIKSKHLDALFALQDPKMYQATPYDGIALTAYTKYFNSYVAGKTDLNTAMRNAADELNAKIKEQQSK
jgi:multiple sugar transport system substrate-binding protein